MNIYFIILMIIAMIATLLALGLGLFAFIKGGEFNEKYGNKLMKARIYFQGAALALLALAILVT